MAWPEGVPVNRSATSPTPVCEVSLGALGEGFEVAAHEGALVRRHEPGAQGGFGGATELGGGVGRRVGAAGLAGGVRATGGLRSALELGQARELAAGRAVA